MTARTPKGDACSHFFGIIELMKKLCKTDIRFMWLLQDNTAPSHMTINNFMKDYLVKSFKWSYSMSHWWLNLNRINFWLCFASIPINLNIVVAVKIYLMSTLQVKIFLSIFQHLVVNKPICYPRTYLTIKIKFYWVSV